jgi:hypothetical protein
MANGAAKTGPVDTRYQRNEIAMHLAKFPAISPIRVIWARPEFEAKLLEFEAADALAIKAQAHFRAMGRLALTASTTGALIGAALLLPKWLIEWLPPGLIGIVQTAALGVAVALIGLLTATKRVNTWMGERAKAEQLRSGLFRMLVDAAPPSDADPRLATSQKLELLDAAHIRHQLGFFDKQGAKFRKQSSRWTPLRIAGYALFGVVALLAVPLVANVLIWFGVRVPVVSELYGWLVTHEADRWRLAAATIASSLLTHASARSAMDQDTRNADLYALTAEKVRTLLAKRTPDVATDEVALSQHFDNLQRVLDAEHFAWFVSPPDIVVRGTPAAGVRRE